MHKDGFSASDKLLKYSGKGGFMFIKVNTAYLQFLSFQKSINLIAGAIYIEGGFSETNITILDCDFT